MTLQQCIKRLSPVILFNLLFCLGIGGSPKALGNVTQTPKTIDFVAQTRETSVPSNDLKVDVALETLRTANQGTRDKIIKDLKQQGSINIPTLINALGESDALIKSAAAEVLGSFGEESEPAIAALVHMLDDSRFWNVPGSGYSLIPAVPRLRPPVLPAPAFSANSSAPKRRIPQPLKNPEYALNISAAAALGQIGGIARNSATPKLAALLKSSDPWMQINAGWALMQMGADIVVLPTFTQLLKHPDPLIRAEVISVLGNREGLIHKILGAESTPETTSDIVLALDHPNSFQRFQLRTALRTIGTNAIAPLTAGLSHPSPFLRLEAAKALGEQEYKAIAAIPTLLTLLDDPAQAMRKPRRSFTLPSYLSPPQLTIRRSPRVISRDGLGYYSRPVNSEKFVKIEAIVALQKIVGESLSGEVKAAFYESLSDPMAGMRLTAAWAILSSEQHRVSPENQRRIINTMIAIAPPTDRLAKSQTPDESHALSLLKSIGKPAASYLRPYYETQLDTPDQNAWIQAIIALGRLGSSALPTVPRLRNQYLGSDTIFQGYSATILGEIAMDLEQQSKLGILPYPQRLTAIREFEEVLAIMESPRHRFNQQPVDRVRRSLSVLQTTVK